MYLTTKSQLKIVDVLDKVDAYDASNVTGVMVVKTDRGFVLM